MLKCKSLYVNGIRLITATKIIVFLKVWRESSKCEIYFITHCVPFATTNGNRNSSNLSFFLLEEKREETNHTYLLDFAIPAVFIMLWYNRKLSRDIMTTKISW
jgi:hypothetical protein